MDLLVRSIRPEIGAELLDAWLLAVEGSTPDGRRLAGEIRLTWAVNHHRFVYDPLNSSVTVDGRRGSMEDIRGVIPALEHSASEVAALTAITRLASSRLRLLPERLAEMTDYSQARCRRAHSLMAPAGSPAGTGAGAAVGQAVMAREPRRP